VRLGVGYRPQTEAERKTLRDLLGQYGLARQASVDRNGRQVLARAKRIQRSVSGGQPLAACGGMFLRSWADGEPQTPQGDGCFVVLYDSPVRFSRYCGACSGGAAIRSASTRRCGGAFRASRVIRRSVVSLEDWLTDRRRKLHR
jgi:hypothetical protein